MPIPDVLAALYEVHEWRNGIALLEHVHPEEFRDVIDVLRGFRLRKSHLVKAKAAKGAEIEPADEDDEEEEDNAGDTASAAGGGNKSKMAKELDREA